jgi:hypothetical protein
MFGNSCKGCSKCGFYILSLGILRKKCFVILVTSTPHETQCDYQNNYNTLWHVELSRAYLLQQMYSTEYLFFCPSM